MNFFFIYNEFKSCKIPHGCPMIRQAQYRNDVPTSRCKFDALHESFIMRIDLRMSHRPTCSLLNLDIGGIQSNRSFSATFLVGREREHYVRVTVSLVKFNTTRHCQSSLLPRTVEYPCVDFVAVYAV